MLLGKLCFLFLPFFVSGLHLERRGYRDLVVKVVDENDEDKESNGDYN